MSTLPGSKDPQDAKQRLEDLKKKIDFHSKWLTKYREELLALHDKRPLNQKENIAQGAALKFKEQQIHETQRMINYLEAKVKYLATIVGD